MNNQLPPKVIMMQMVLGYVPAKAIHVAARLNIADLIAGNGPMTCAELAMSTGVHEGSLYRLLRALASIGIFKEEENGKFSLTPMAECLVENSPNSIKAISLGTGDVWYQAYEELSYAVKTGDPGFQRAIGMPIFQYLANNPQQGKIFDRMMTDFHGGETTPMVENYDFGVFGTVADVGGGNGSVIAAVLDRYPNVKGILYDLPEVVNRSKENIDKWGLSNRCQIQAGNFFETAPKGADAYILRHIVHDWNDEDSAKILSNCREAMNPGGKILVVEAVIPHDNEPHSFKWLDLTMLMIGGRERTREQFEALFKKAGLKINRIVPFMPELGVVEGVSE